MLENFEEYDMISGHISERCDFANISLSDIEAAFACDPKRRR
jgi:hypothetical protein